MLSPSLYAVVFDDFPGGEAITGNCNVQDVSVTTVYDTRYRSLVAPCNICLALSVSCLVHGESFLFQTVMSVDCSLLFVMVGQEHVEALRRLLSTLATVCLRKIGHFFTLVIL